MSFSQPERIASATLHIGDCLDVLPQLAAEGFRAHAVVTDPPYGLEFMGVAWDTFGDRPKGRARPRNEWNDFGSREHARNASEQAGIARKKNLSFQEFSAAWARAVFDCMLPGAHLVACGGTRTFHRMVCAIEDAGFEVRDTVLWVHSQGFPKHRNALKPAVEMICIARRPLSEGNVAANVLRHGTGAINVDACRVGTTENTGRPGTISKGGILNVQPGGCVRQSETHAAGRYPANLLHDGSPEVEQAFAEFGERPGFGGGGRREGLSREGLPFGLKNGGAVNYYADTGSPSRFFFTAKADARDRAGSKHPCVKPSSLMRWLVRLVCPEGGTILDPFAGTGSTGLAADQCGMRSVLIERDPTYAGDALRKIREDAPLFAEASPVPDLDAAYQRHGDLFADAAD